MVDRDTSIVALVPARAGSKRVPDKNIRPLSGHPVIAYTIAAALDSKIFTDVIVSTDSELYAEIVKYYGAEVPFLRPPELAGDQSPDIEWLEYTLDRLQTEARIARKERDRLRELLLDHEAAALTASAQLIGPVSLVRQLFENREMEEARRLATRIANQPGHVVLLGVSGKKAQLIFARSPDLSYDMRRLLQEACSLVGGGGGGGPGLAQGGGPHPDRIDQALQHATELLRQQISPAGER